MDRVQTKLVRVERRQRPKVCLGMRLDLCLVLVGEHLDLLLLVHLSREGEISVNLVLVRIVTHIVVQDAIKVGIFRQLGVQFVRQV